MFSSDVKHVLILSDIFFLFFGVRKFASSSEINDNEVGKANHCSKIKCHYRPLNLECSYQIVTVHPRPLCKVIFFQSFPDAGDYVVKYEWRKCRSQIREGSIATHAPSE